MKHLILVLIVLFVTCSNTVKSQERSGKGSSQQSSFWSFLKTDTFYDYVDDSCGIEVDLVAVKGGTYFMGCDQNQEKCGPDETPMHEVRIDDFYISRYEITNKQFCVFLNKSGIGANATKNGKQFISIDEKLSQIDYMDGKFVPQPGKENYPVVEVSWFGAVAFCTWAGGRLPTEAEWEYAARGGSESKDYIYSGSNDLDEVAWHFENSKTTESSNFYEGHGTHPIGEKLPNELGIYDMTGNVYEWCSDRYNRDYYGYSPKDNPQGPEHGNSRVLRGGSWGDQSKACRTRYRVSVGEYTNYFMYGFRYVKDRH
jgi:sulfatase modifying factor 1